MDGNNPGYHDSHDSHADSSDVTDSDSRPQNPRLSKIKKPLFRRFQSEQQVTTSSASGWDTNEPHDTNESENDSAASSGKRRRRPSVRAQLKAPQTQSQPQSPVLKSKDSPHHNSLRAVSSGSKRLAQRFHLGNFSLRSPKIQRKQSSYFTDNEDSDDDARLMVWGDRDDTQPLMAQSEYGGHSGQFSYGSVEFPNPPSLKLPPAKHPQHQHQGIVHKASQFMQSRVGIQSMMSETGPERRFYDDFTTVDWVRDTINDSSRVKYIQSIPGFRGRLIRSFDSLQDWILISIIAASFALIAYSIDRVEETLFDFKFGYCSSSWLTPRSECEGQWMLWSELTSLDLPYLGENPYLSAQTFNFLAYLLIMLLLAFLAVRITLRTKTSSPISLKDNKPRVFYTAYGSGVAEVKTILSGFVIRRFLGTHTLVYKSVGLVLAVSSGLCLGKEGPYVHLATCVGNIACRLFTKFSHNDLRRRQILAAAASAGVALAFGSPLGGVLFSLEEVSYMFMPAQLFRVFFCAMTSALFLKLLDPYKTGKIVLFEVKYTQDWHSPEILVFVILGICGGIFGALFCKFSAWWPQKVRAPGKIFHGHHTIEVLVVTIITGLTSFSSPFTRQSVAELLYQLASPCDPDNPELSKLCPTSVGEIPGVAKALAWVLVLKIFLTCITFGIKVPAGIYVPSMIIGALFGRVMGLGTQLLYHRMLNEKQSGVLSMITAPFLGALATCPGGALECITPGTYAMIGAGAFMAGVTRMNVTLAVILFELTGSLDYVLPFSIAILVANWVANLIEPKSVYELQIKKNDYPFLDNRKTLAFDSSLADLVSHFPRKLCIDMDEGDEDGSAKVTVGQLKEMLAQVQVRNGIDGSIPLVRNDNVVGLLPALELEVALDRISQWYEEVAGVVVAEPGSAAAVLAASPPNETTGLKLSLGIPSTEAPPPIAIVPPSALDSIVCTVSVKDVDITKFHYYYVGVKARETCETDPEVSSNSSACEDGLLPFEATDLTQFVDRAPLALDVHSPLTLVQMMFSKLGVRQICVVEDGQFVGVLHKKKFIDFCNNQEK
ncbi:H(+)/Cl(-) exchange transporter 4 [Yarrowia sp. C11]|nr:H(+)/Cl(-) exchange transporter 4 [Yarrowia sp. E02]KAG5365248.1 H(+)/Cl(-) exchange transporter 4 [Yarrowia sp. C11]